MINVPKPKSDMYYPASETIAAKWPQWRETIAKIDGLLHDNAGKIVCVDFLASFVSESPRTVDQVLQKLAELEVVEEIEAKCCPNHPNVLLDLSCKSGILYCDLCDQDFEQSTLPSTRALKIMSLEVTPQSRPKVFISHSSVDKLFVQRLVNDLKKEDIPVWFDMSDILVGDSIVQKINAALSESDYLIVVLSKASVESAWVKNELDFALMEEKSEDSIVILPVKIERCDVPPLLRSRLYADFSEEYERGLDALKRVLLQEKLKVVKSVSEVKHRTSCEESLAALSAADLRRRLKAMSRDELTVVWYDLFSSRMRDDMDGRTLSECLVELLLRASSRNVTGALIRSVCSERDDLGNS